MRQRGAYVSSLPSTPQQARYTAAPSAYTDPTVKASPPAWWGSSLGGCAGCGDLGLNVDEINFRAAAVNAAIGAGIAYLWKSGKASRTELIVGAVAGAVFSVF
jgi:hypothetical protein